jgi:Carbohydrate-selective porin, OprB family
MVWRPSPDSPKSVGVFARVMGAPSDRNLLDFNVDAGVVMKAPFKGRDNDSVGLAVSYAQVSSSASAFDRDIARVDDAGVPRAFRRNGDRGDLSIPSDAVVATASGPLVLLPSGRWHPGPEHGWPYRQRSGGGAANSHHVLTDRSAKHNTRSHRCNSGN